jgi:hypothetical protein
MRLALLGCLDESCTHYRDQGKTLAPDTRVRRAFECAIFDHPRHVVRRLVRDHATFFLPKAASDLGLAGSEGTSVEHQGPHHIRGVVCARALDGT